MNNIIVNSEDNKQLALYIGNKIRNFKTTYPMKRDYCGDINDELREELSYDGIRCKRIYGLYKVNTFIGWLDEDDFTDDELDEITKKYGGTYREDLEEYVKSLPEDKQKEHLYIPHVFLQCKELILDAASDMFNGFGKHSKYRYFYDNYTPVIGVR